MGSEILFISGFPRCGSSMIMQMLAAGGATCAGRFPAFEPIAMQLGTVPEAFLLSHVGHAVKRLEPLRVHVGSVAYRTIWLDRDSDEQAKSHATMVSTLFNLAPFTRSARKKIAASLRADRQRTVGALRGPLLTLQFEDVLRDPAYAAGCIAAFSNPVVGNLNIAAMSSAVVARSARARSDMSLELALIERDLA